MSALSAARRMSFKRQMAFSRNSSTESNDIEGFAVRSGHLAPPTNTPDSPRPQKTSSSGAEALSTTLTIPSDKAAADSKQKSTKPSQLSSK